jgi:DHA3 family multidrug efflux protein-like MFS transporter
VHLEHQSKVDLRGTFAVVAAIPGLLALILFSTINNFLGGTFMGLMDAYGLSLVSVETWGLLFAVISCGFIVGGLFISKYGLGKNPLIAMFAANIIIWVISAIFTIQPSIILLSVGMFIYISVVPFIEAAEQTILQKVVPHERQGRVFGFAQSVEQSASPLTTFLIGPIAETFFIPFMSTGAGVGLIGSWFGTGPDRGIALVFTVTGIIGLILTIVAMNSKYAQMLSERYINHAPETLPEGELA